MEMTSKPPRDAEQSEQALAQNLTNEVLAWRMARSQRYDMTATGVPVLRRNQRKRRVQPEAWS